MFGDTLSSTSWKGVTRKNDGQGPRTEVYGRKPRAVCLHDGASSVPPGVYHFVPIVLPIQASGMKSFLT